MVWRLGVHTLCFSRTPAGFRKSHVLPCVVVSSACFVSTNLDHFLRRQNQLRKAYHAIDKPVLQLHAKLCTEQHQVRRILESMYCAKRAFGSALQHTFVPLPACLKFAGGLSVCLAIKELADMCLFMDSTWSRARGSLSTVKPMSPDVIG